MRYGKMVSDGYIIGISNDFGIEITETEYNKILVLVHDKPTSPLGYEYMLRADNLEWELCELSPIDEPDEDATIEDYEEAIGRFGV